MVLGLPAELFFLLVIVFPPLAHWEQCAILQLISQPPCFCFAACFNFLMSSFTILSMACMTRCDFSASLSLNNSPRTLGTICHESPYSSFPFRLSPSKR